MAWKDEDGYLWFVGRADDVIKSSGYRIGPFEVESALMTHPAVIECAITGVPDEIRGQVVKATVVLSKEYKTQAGEALIKELQNHVKRLLHLINIHVSLNSLMNCPKLSAERYAVWKFVRTMKNKIH